MVKGTGCQFMVIVLVFMGLAVHESAIEDPLYATAIEEVEDDEGGCSLALQALLKEVTVGEESYKTPTKGKSRVAISFEIEEFANVEVSLPPPEPGMIFDSWKKIDSYFRDYGKQQGFGVVRPSGATIGKGSNAKDKRSVTWTCECYGMPSRRGKKTDAPTFVSDSQIYDEVCLKRKSKKVQCLVKLYVKLNEGGDWVADKAILEHKGHSPTPGKSKNTTKFRKKFLTDNPHILKQVFNDRMAGVLVAKIFNCMARQRNGREEMQFTQKDLHDEVAKQGKIIFEEGDAKGMFAYFKRMVDDNPLFSIPIEWMIWVVSKMYCGSMLGAGLPYWDPNGSRSGDEESIESDYARNRSSMCIWHITQKFAKKFGKLKNYTKIETDLESAIDDSLACEEFEANGLEAIKKHELEDDEWLQAYTDFPAELVFQKIYTDAKFKEVQRECNRVIYVSEIHRNRVSDIITEFVVEDRVWYKPKGSRKENSSKRKREYKLSFDSSTKHVTCDCRHFEFHGIICRHIIRVYQINNYYEIPYYYILRMWRKHVIRKHTRVKVCYHDPSKAEEVCRYDKMMVRFGTLCSNASGSIQTTVVVMQAL
ncbi:protein FAR1-RELATED SEQUENCE 1-like [Chenopodium quinoa]|uniref:protein FAR1-RELATED SEQUENCE 1-like n=1 Tax=Chenopodium quinoa TaxID=63459 RepID=UPI000B7951F5|nr:protein FAR1-RELATED SEQUENCE 1-like [Chenopodium quinoa]